MQTYEISQYQRKPQYDSSHSSMKNTANSTKLSWDTYFNMNLQKSISFDGFEHEEQMKDKEKDLKKLRLENVCQNDKINSLLQHIKQLTDNKSALHNDLTILNEENQELKRLVEDLEHFGQDNNRLRNQNEQLTNELNQLKQNNSQNKIKKYEDEIVCLKEQLDNKGQDKDLLEEIDRLKKDQDYLQHQNMQLKQDNLLAKEQGKEKQDMIDEINRLKTQLDHLYNTNKNLYDQNKEARGQGKDNQELNDDINRFKNENNTLKSQIRSITDDFNNQISKMGNHINCLEREKKLYEKAKAENKQLTDNIIKELTEKNNTLEKECDDMNKKLYHFKKLNQGLMREKEGLLTEIKQLEDNIHKLKTNPQNKSKGSSDNKILFECLKNENEELKNQNQKLKRLIELLLRFVNNLSSLFGYEECILDHCKDHPEDLQTRVNTLEGDIQALLNNGNDDSKWNKIQEKLEYHPKEEDIEKEPIKEEGEDYPLGKCNACDLGRNVTLKGCSPLFVKKKTNPTNLPLNRRPNN